jgi:hypothetical protein
MTDGIVFKLFLQLGCLLKSLLFKKINYYDYYLAGGNC